MENKFFYNISIQFNVSKIISFVCSLAIIFSFYSYFNLKNVLAQQKDIKVKLGVLNGGDGAITLPTDHKIKLSANGVEVYAKCVKTVCAQMTGRCVGDVAAGENIPWNWSGCRKGNNCRGDGYYEQQGNDIYISYKMSGEDGKGKKRGPCNGGSITKTDDLWTNVTLNSGNKCSVRVEMEWECNGWDYKKKENVKYGTFKATYEEYCASTQCSEWEIQADNIISLMPDIGIAAIDVNLIEY